MDNKFSKLKKEYKDFIKINAAQIKKLNIESDLTKEKCNAIYRLYNKMYKTIESSEQLNVNDINHIILNYSKEDSDIELFKKFIKIKNLFLVKLVVRSNLWDPFIAKLATQFNIKADKNAEYNLSKGVYRLLIESVEQFRGCWEIVEFNTNSNKLKRIEIIEPDHLEYLKKYLKSKSIK